MARKRKIFAPREGLIQAAVIDHWRLLGVPGSLVAVVPNANAHGQPGLTRGLFDLVVMSPTLGDKTGWLELKADDGELSDDQKAIKLIMIARGVPYAVAYGRDEPIKILELWGAVRQVSNGEAWHGCAGPGVAWPGKAKQGKDIAA